MMMPGETIREEMAARIFILRPAHTGISSATMTTAKDQGRSTKKATQHNQHQHDQLPTMVQGLALGHRAQALSELRCLRSRNREGGSRRKPRRQPRARKTM